jgi:flagellar biosynthesis/type III secretory pathway protein FliH
MIWWLGANPRNYRRESVSVRTDRVGHVLTEEEIAAQQTERVVAEQRERVAVACREARRVGRVLTEEEIAAQQRERVVAEQKERVAAACREARAKGYAEGFAQGRAEERERARTLLGDTLGTEFESLALTLWRSDVPTMEARAVLVAAQVEAVLAAGRECVGFRR